MYLPVALAVLVVILGLIAFALVRYRAAPGRAPAPTRDRTGVEVGIALGLATIVAALVAVTLAANARETRVVPQPGFRVEVLAYRWGWQFSYPSLPGVVDRSGVRRPAVLHVPARTTVRIGLRTQDVTHAFWVPAVRFKRDAWPGDPQVFDVAFPPGDHISGHCAQYCGLKHSDMVFTVEALEPAEFRAWTLRARGRSP